MGLGKVTGIGRRNSIDLGSSKSMRIVVVYLCGLLSLIFLFFAAAIRVEEPVSTQYVCVKAELNDITLDEMLIEATTLTVETSDLDMITYDRFWFVLLPVEPSGLDSCGLASYSGLSGEDADLRGTIVSYRFRVESKQSFTARTRVEDGTSVWVRMSGEYLQMYVRMPFSEDFACTILEPEKEAAEAVKDNLLQISYWMPAVVEGTYKEGADEVELPPVPWGTTTSLVDVEALEAIDEALGLLFVPILTARYLEGDLAPGYKAHLLFQDIQRIPMSFQLGVVFHTKTLLSPIEIRPSSPVVLKGELVVEFPDGRRIMTKAEDTTEITLLEGTVTIDGEARLVLEGTASRLTLTGIYGKADKLTKRGSLFEALPLPLQMLIPIPVGLFLSEILFHRRRPKT